MKTAKSIHVFRAFVTGLLLATVLAWPLAARGDWMELRNGERLVGRIESATTNHVIIISTNLGTVSVNWTNVTALATDGAMKLSLTNGAHFMGRMNMGSNGVLVVDGGLGANVSTARLVWVRAVWLPDAPEPPPPADHDWKYSVMFDLVGHRGNGHSLDLGGGADVVRCGPASTLKFFANGAYGTTEGTLASSRAAAGGDMEWRFWEQRASWYVRDEISEDKVQGIESHDVLATGFGYYLLRSPGKEIRFRTGLGYLYTHYADPERVDDSSPTLDAGLQARFKLCSHVSWKNEITSQYVLREPNNLFFSQESFFALSFAHPALSQEIGFSNHYYSRPSTGIDSWESRYFARLRLTW